MLFHENISALFSPNAVAVIGASEKAGKIGNIILSNIIRTGFGGKIFPIHPKADTILGLQAYRKVADIPDSFPCPDLAVICLPAESVPASLDEASRTGCRAAIIISAGFKETGGQGAALENEVRALALKKGMALLGPNSLGLAAAGARLNATFAKGDFVAGNIGFFSQSGAFCVAIFDWAKEQNFGFSSFVSLGNKAVVDESDMLAHMAEDPHTKVIAGYLESVENGPRFLHNAQLATRKKPVILLKAGRTEEGARAASSHTGALAGADMAYEAAFRQTGIIRAASMEELFAMAQAFAVQPLPKGPGIAIVTNAGGPGIVATDACVGSGLTLARLSADSLTALKELLPSYAAFYNPVDVVSDAKAERVAGAARIVLADPSVHALLILSAATAHIDVDQLAEEVAALPNPEGKPIFACFMGGEGVAGARRYFADRGIPCYPFPEPAIGALAAMYRQSRWKENPMPVEVGYRHDKSRVRSVIDAARAEGLSELVEYHSQAVLKAYEMPCLEAKLARTSDEAVQIAKQIGGAVALKIASPHILHKTEVQGVALNLVGADAVRAAFMDITSRTKRLHKNAYIAGCLVQAMAPTHSREVIIGFKRDRRFGPMVIFGLGGIHVEAFKDISCRLAPLSLDDAHDMVREIRAFPVLAGMRGEKAVKFTALEDLLLIMAQLAVDFPEIQEAECNPVLAGPEGAWVADIRILLTPASRSV
ncbi:acetate--CoA ligase family protein [Desulfovibrio sp. OttesenSCG-928-F20]|nr:acetate--CoA ligase family protein [Desulfovibrio sp. OttesenSCG-928-F20]